MRKLGLVCLAVAIAALGLSHDATADNKKGRSYPVQSAPASVTEYSRISSKKPVNGQTAKIDNVLPCGTGDVVCSNFKTSTSPLKAMVTCSGSANASGGWIDTGTAGGRCFDSVDVSYDIGGTNVYAGTVTGTPAMTGLSLTPKSTCGVSGGPAYDTVKQDCAFGWTYGAGATLTKNVTGATGDDMFGVVSTASPLATADASGNIGAFFEYPRVAPGASGISSKYRLNYIYRNPSVAEKHPELGLMLPSGPASTYNDFKRFIDHPPIGVTVEGACYPVDINICNPVAITLPPLPGKCGGSNGGSFYSQPSDNLCAYGNMLAMNGAGPWSWQCPGFHGGANASCSAKLKVDGQCGPDNAASFYGLPASGRCNAGTVSSVSGSGPWSWQCLGLNGGVNSSCMANLRVDGHCGSSNGNAYYNQPTTGLCSSGAGPTGMSGSGPWAWTCAGANGGTGQACTAQLKTDGQCGSANGSPASSTPSTNLCSVGGAFNMSGSGPYSWNCGGTNGGNAAACSAPQLPTEACLPNNQNATGQTQCPTNSCFLYVSGSFTSANPAAVDPSQFHAYEIVGDTTNYGNGAYGSAQGNIVGMGSYADAFGSAANRGPFYDAELASFDSMALGSKTHITIYQQPNFTGGVVADLHGPLLIENKFSVLSAFNYQYDNVMRNGTFSSSSDPLYAQFPPSAIKWSDQVGASNPNMWYWGGVPNNPHDGFGPLSGPATSIKVTCDP